ncbi:hypothetical protein [Micromonospora sp. NPDC049282]|uniref:hypothetical protein n=1 Tax=Micromonospora sp. NPDC049282 TaxID=3364269 RepID=UPI00371C3CB1
MTWFASVTTQPGGEPPALLTLGVWSTLVMATVFISTLLSYLLPECGPVLRPSGRG